MNAVLQCIWNIEPLKQSVMEFVQLEFSDKNMTAEQRLLVEIQLLFNDAT
jgi:dynactin complex subunit